ncbi:MAG: hypothetical protein R8M46_01445 [Ghiorsea sp.]
MIQKIEVRTVLIWQLSVVVFVAAVATIFFSGWVSILFGGLLVMLSTWHVHKSVYASEGDRMILLKLAGIRFALFLVILGIGVGLLGLQPIYMVAGMASAYIALYAKSLLTIFRQMKGDSLG